MTRLIENVAKPIAKSIGYPVTGRDATAAFGIADDFNRADSSTLGNTPTGDKAWTEYSGNWQISSNACNLAAVTGIFNDAQIAAVDAERADNLLFTAHCSLPGVGDLIGLAVRVTDANNAWLIELYTGVNQCSIVEWNARSRTYRGGVAQSPALDHVTEYLLTCEVAGDTITCYTDAHVGAQTSYALASFQNTATIHGLYGFNGVNNGQVNDFEIAELP